MVYYSELIGKPIIDKNQKKIGKIKDFSFIDGTRYATISGIICEINKMPRMIKWEYVAEIGDKPNDSFQIGIYLNKEIGKVTFHEVERPILKDLLDKQLIDIGGARVIRVNDILLGRIGSKLAVIGVDVSTKGMLRRLGVFKSLLVRMKEQIIMWKDVAPLTDEIRNLQIKTKRDMINELHPAEIADLIRDLNIEEKVMVFNSLTDQKAGETLLVSHPDVQKTFFKSISLKRLASILETMPTDDAASILNMMPSVHNANVLRLMKPGIAAKIKKILSYGKRTAGKLMSTAFTTIKENLKVKEVIDILKEKMPKEKHMSYIYVEDYDGTLKGIVSFRDLLFADKKSTIKEIMNTDIIVVHENTDIDDVLNLMGKYEFIDLPVVDKNKKIVGVIRVHNILEVILPKKIKKQRIVRLNSFVKNKLKETEKNDKELNV